MKINILLPLKGLLAGLLLLFSSCEDKCTNTYIYQVFEPVYMTLSDFRSAVKTLPARPLQNPGKIYIKGNYLFINEPGKGIHVFDNTNPAAPQNLSFINIPGNVDLAVKDNILYADSHIDMVALDISNPAAIKVSKRLENVFKASYQRYLNYGFLSTGTLDSLRGIIVDWNMREIKEVSECSPSGNVWYNTWVKGGSVDDYAAVSASPQTQSVANSGSPGQGGSTSRFALSKNFLYAVDYSQLYLFDASQAAAPTQQSKILINGGWNIETIFPYKNTLFIGSSNGMFIFDNTDPANPKQLSAFSHARACDPVVADDEYAYVTLRSVNVTTSCGLPQLMS